MKFTDAKLEQAFTELLGNKGFILKRENLSQTKR